MDQHDLHGAGSTQSLFEVAALTLPRVLGVDRRFSPQQRNRGLISSLPIVPIAFLQFRAMLNERPET